MKEIDLTTWKRKQHFDFFHRMDYPQYTISFDMDSTSFLPALKRGGHSFYATMMHLSLEAACSVEPFCQRIRKNRVVQHDVLHPSFTYMEQGEELFSLITLDYKENIQDFERHMEHVIAQQNSYFDFGPLEGRDDFIYFSAIPWISFNHISHTISLNRDDSVPRISWGKYYTSQERSLLPYSVQVNHCLVDGFHIHEFKDALQGLLDEFV
jgi:chloramphenicol O-acetyltransferase type A